MKSTQKRIERFRKAYPEIQKSDKEILHYLNFHRQLRAALNSTIKA